MKYTDLDEYLIFESRKTFEQLWVKEYGEEILYLDEKFLSALYGIPDAEQVKSQLLHNIEVIGDTEREKYISSLKQNYLRIFYTDLINRLRETEYNFRLSIDRTHDDDDLPKRPFDRFKDDTDFYDENSKDDKTISLLAYVLNRVVRALNNVKKLRLLAETIEETINDAEQSLPQHSLKVEAVEEKEQAEKAKNKLNFKYTKYLLIFSLH